MFREIFQCISAHNTKKRTIFTYYRTYTEAFTIQAFILTIFFHLSSWFNYPILENKLDYNPCQRINEIYIVLIVNDFFVKINKFNLVYFSYIHAFID